MEAKRSAHEHLRWGKGPTNDILFSRASPQKHPGNSRPQERQLEGEQPEDSHTSQELAQHYKAERVGHYSQN